MTRKNRMGNPGGLSGISRIFLEHNAFLKKFLARFLRHEQDIEDISQQAYLQAYSAEQKRGVIEQPKAFLFSIAKNLALNELSRKSRQMTAYIKDAQAPYSIEDGTSVEEELQARQTLGLYCEAVSMLPETCRRVYLLRKVHGLPHKEIAERLGISRSAVEKHLRMGMQCCRDYMLRKQGGDSLANHTVGREGDKVSMDKVTQ